jgi:hypothetical protein
VVLRRTSLAAGGHPGTDALRRSAELMGEVLCWTPERREQELGRAEEALREARRAVELGQRGPILLGTLGYILAKVGRRDEALAIRAELRERAEHEYIAPVAELHVDLGLGDESSVEASLRRNVEAETGPTSLSVVLIRDLEALLDHPTLGPLVRMLSLYNGR